jgi:hypothetical protein
MYRCSEVVRLISSDEYLAAGFWKRFQIRFHLAMCDDCSRFVRQLRAIARAFREKSVEDVPAAEVESAKSHILQRLKEK